MQRKYAVIEKKKVINIIVEVEQEVLTAAANKYIDFTDGWDYSNGIDGGDFFPIPLADELAPDVTE